MPVAVGTSSLNVTMTAEALEGAAKEVDRQLNADRQYPEIAQQLGVASHTFTSFSGVNDNDYPNLSAQSGLSAMELVEVVKRVPLPSELVEQFEHMQCNCMMGLFPEIRRAWLTIDSDIFVWNYEDGSDLAYFDGLSETILCASLVKPKPEILRDSVKYILCLTTPVDIVMLAVTFSSKMIGSLGVDEFGEMHLQPDPLFTIPSDNVYFTCITGTFSGRIFMGGKDGCVYEVSYQATDSWFQRKCRKINHSSSMLSFLVPSFLNATLSGEDPIVQLAVDNTRNILYARSERGTIQVFDLGADGRGMRYVACSSQDTVAHKAAATTRLDHNNFKPLVHIAPVSRNESQVVNLVGITQAGARLYFCTTPSASPFDRPSMLNLVHVRMPPGFAPSALPRRPTKVHTAYYRQGVLLLSAEQAQDTDVLWGVSADPFPFQLPLKEMQVTVTLDGRSWAVSEVPEFLDQLIAPCPIVSERWPDSPAVVRQHFMPQRSFVVLSAKGSHLLATYRPAEQLRQLLVAGRGPDSEAVQAFFKLHKEDQACAICLVLACSTSVADQQVAEWACRAFFKYGGYSHESSQAPSGTSAVDSGFGVYPPGSTNIHTTGSPSSGGSLGGSYLTSPTQHMGYDSVDGRAPAALRHSTPQVGLTGRAVLHQDAVKSGKHDGICLFLARILGTVWDCNLVFEDYLVSPAMPQQNTQVLRSKFSSVQLGWVLDKLRELKTWMEQHLQFALPYANGSLPAMMNGGQSFLQRHQVSAEVLAAERSSLTNLKMLVDRCCEALALWQLLCEHDFEAISLHLDPVAKDRLKYVRFRDLATSSQEVSSALISALMKCFLEDSSSTEAISERLRHICPSLYSSDDAVCTRAGELLILARRTEDKNERARLLRDALQYYRQVNQLIDLELICSTFESVRFYEGVVHLCLDAASKADPQELALHFYRSGQPAGDGHGHQVFVARQRYYKCIMDTLQRLLVASETPAQSTGLPTRPGPPPAPDPNALTAHGAEQYMELMLALSLSSGDELWHMTLYQWLIDNALTERLLEIQSPYLEAFLKMSIANQPSNDANLLDLLWRYYEKARNYSAAARILSKLAEREGADVNLESRLEYLSRAIMSGKSSNLRTSSSAEGEFLHELEEKLEVARIQLQIFEALGRLQASRPSSDITDALTQLNSRLMDVTTLYGDFADVFRLSECKLAIVFCAGHYDPTLIEALWGEIIEKELRESIRRSASNRVTLLSEKIVALGKTYVHSERYFPLNAIILMLEKKGAELDWDPTWVFTTMLEIGIPFPVLHAIYDRLFKAKDPCWQAMHKPLHILTVLYHLLLKFVETPSLMSPYERPSFTTTLYDACATYLVELESICSRDPSVQSLLTKFKGMQARFKRIL